MKQFKLDDYESLLPKIDLSSGEIEAQIKDYKLVFDRYGVNNKEGFPPFVSPFYDFILKNKRIPNQKEFWSAYQNDHHLFFDENNLKNFFRSETISEFIPGIEKRVNRNYPSLVRDVHFGKYLTEHGFTVTYNQELDMKQGVDLMITNNNKHYGLCLFTDTPDGRKQRDKKLAKRMNNEPFDNVTYIELPISFTNSDVFTCGDFFLYSEVDFERIEGIILKVEKVY